MDLEDWDNYSEFGDELAVDEDDPLGEIDIDRLTHKATEGETNE